MREHLPTTIYPNEEVDQVYKEIYSILINRRAYNAVMGDVNAREGPGEVMEICIGSFVICTRNRRGEVLVEFAERYKCKIISTFLKKTTEQIVEIDLSKRGNKERD